MNKKRVVIHHSATPDSPISFSWNAIRRYHVEVNKWRDIGYHLGFEQGADALGKVSYEALLGRPIDADGAHCPQQNSNVEALGVVFIGNFDLAPPPHNLLIFGARHLAAFMRALGIQVSRDTVKGHYEFNSYKSCPGKYFNMDTFVDLLRVS